MKRENILSTAQMILNITLVIATGAQIIGCSEESCVDCPGIRNYPPCVWLSSAPPEGSTTVYKIDMEWGGWDPDGKVAYFEYAITDNDDGTFDPADTTGSDKWNKVYGNEGEFTFTADELADTNTSDLVTEFVRSHTFFIRAVDDEGLASPRPAYRSFTARTLSPKVSVTYPPGGTTTPAIVSPITTFTWIAEDYIDDLTSSIEPNSVSWILEPTASHNMSWEQTLEYIRNLPVDSPEWDTWGGWKSYGAPDGRGKSWTTPPLNYEPYVFAIRAKDEAGAITPVFDLDYNVRNVQVSHIDTGPLLTVRNEFIGSVTTAICNGPFTIVDMPGGVPIEFCFEASSDHYPGTITGYRYGWDIDDLNDPEDWETDYLPYPGGEICLPIRTFYFGTHLFTIEVIDNSGYCSRVEIKINLVQFTMERNLLVVDDYVEATPLGWEDPVAPGLTPSDQEHDQFWESVLDDLEGFHPGGDVLNVRRGDLIPLTELARYKSIVWSVYGHIMQPEVSVLHEYIKYDPMTRGIDQGGKRKTNILALFMAAGGHLLICGNHPVSMAINPRVTMELFYFPIIWQYEIGGCQSLACQNFDLVGSESFAYRDLCLETMDFAFTTAVRRRDRFRGVYCPVDAVRTIPSHSLRDHTMRAAIPIDPTFPRLELRPEAAGPGRAFHEDNKGLDAEVYNPQYFFDLCPYVVRSRDCFEPIYGLECHDTAEPTYGAPAGFWTSAYADRIADAPGTIAARSAVFGFPPVYFEPEQVRGAIEVILFDEWQLPRK